MGMETFAKNWETHSGTSLHSLGPRDQSHSYIHTYIQTSLFPLLASSIAITCPCPLAHLNRPNVRWFCICTPTPPHPSLSSPTHHEPTPHRQNQLSFSIRRALYPSGTKHAAKTPENPSWRIVTIGQLAASDHVGR